MGQIYFYFKKVLIIVSIFQVQTASLLPLQMYRKRQASEVLSPIFNKQNKNKLNNDASECLKTDCTKRNTLKYSRDKQFKQTQNQTINLGFLTEKNNQIDTFYSICTIKRQKTLVDDERQCNNLQSTKMSTGLTKTSNFCNQSYGFNFIVDSAQASDSDGQEYEVNLLQTISTDQLQFTLENDQQTQKSLLNYNYEEQDFENLQQWDDQIDSSFQSQNDEYFEESQNNLKSQNTKQRNARTPKKQEKNQLFNFSSKLNKQLAQIPQADENTNLFKTPRRNTTYFNDFNNE